MLSSCVIIGVIRHLKNNAKEMNLGMSPRNHQEGTMMLEETTECEWLTHLHACNGNVNIGKEGFKVPSSVSLNDFDSANIKAFYLLQKARGIPKAYKQSSEKITENFQF